MSGTFDICALNEIPEDGAKGFSIATGDGGPEFFIVRKNNRIHGYINRCPHTGVNLNWQADRFLNLDGNQESTE